MNKGQKMVRMSTGTWTKLKYMAKVDRRTLGQEMDFILDEILANRDIQLDESEATTNGAASQD